MAKFDFNKPVSRRAFVGSAAATSALAALAACTPNGSSSGSGSGSAAVDAPELGDNVFSFYLTEPAFIDPYNGQENQGMAVIYALFDGLLDWDYTTNQAVPLAAADMPTVSEDGLTYTFTLREGMTFHNGDPVDAASFKRGWERIANPKMETPSEIAYHLAPIAGYEEYNTGDADEISGVVVKDDLTLEVTLAAPMADFTAVCCHPALSPVPQAALDDPDSFLEAPIGNGPFQMDGEWVHNQYINTVKFDNYYGDAPTVDGVYFSIQKDEKTAFNEFKAGNIDFTMIPTGQIADIVEEYGESEDGYTVTPGGQALTGTEVSVYFLVPNLTNNDYLADVQVRRAISLAIDRQTIVDTVFNGTRKAATSIMPLVIDDNEKNTWEYCQYDPERAKEILTEAGYAEGEISLSLNYNSGGGHEDIMSLIQANLEEVGITVTQASTEWATYLTQLSDGDYDLARLGWTADYPIPDNFLYPNFYSTADNNYEKYDNPEVDAAIEAARQITDEEERLEAYRDVCATIGEDIPLIPVMFYAHTYVGGDRVQSFYYDPTTIPHFASAQLS